MYGTTLYLVIWTKLWPEKCISYFFLFFGHTTQLAGSQFPNQELNPCPLHWKWGVLTTGPPGKSPSEIVNQRAGGRPCWLPSPPTIIIASKNHLQSYCRKWLQKLDLAENLTATGQSCLGACLFLIDDVVLGIIYMTLIFFLDYPITL